MATKWVSLTDKERQWILSSAPPASLLKKMNTAGKRIQISSAKGKGRALQQWVCSKISELTGIPYNQQDDECLIHSREMGQAGTDVILRGEAGEKFPFSIECKNTESLSLIATIHQAQANTKPDRPWLIVYKAKALNTPVVVLEWDNFIRHYKGF